MTTVVCTTCGKVHEGPFQLSREELACPCGGRRVLPSQAKPRKPLRRVSEKKAAQTGRQGSGLKRGRGFAVTKAQREKVQGLPCIGCGREESEYVAIDPAHLWPRGRGGCGDVLCVCSLCRASDYSCHTLFDNGELDLLPALIDRGYWPEIAHMVSHEVSPTQVLERLTGQRWQPVGEAA